MTSTEAGRGRAASARLLEVAGPELYRRNPFRVTGLSTDAGARAIRQQRQRVLTALDLGAAVSVGETRLPLPTPPPPDRVRAAFDELDKTEHRVVDELFWWWGDPGDCGCDAEVHRRHDIAVAVHAEILDLELGDGVDQERRRELWVDAADAWADALDLDGFWSHVEHRVKTLADRRLDSSTVDGLRRTMPQALLAPQVALAKNGSAGLAELLDVWDIDDDLIDDARVAAATPTYESLADSLKEVSRLLDDGNGAAAARLALAELPKALTLLQELVPHERFRRSAMVRDQTAIILNNCATALMDAATEDIASIDALLDNAVRYAVQQESKDGITQNRDAYRTVRGSAAHWRQVTALLEQRRFREVEEILREMRRTTGDPEMITQIDTILTNVRHARSAGVVADAGGWMTVAACLSYVSVMMSVLLGIFGATMITTMIVIGIGALAPMTVVQTRGFRLGPKAASRARGVWSFLFAGFVLWLVSRHNLALALDALLALVVSLPLTIPIGRAIARAWDNR